ncbi:interferon-induced very large GTPase 1 isoform X2 [Salmo salar]|uniref:Interferon-induced very large GTPase 1 isoform X2 n=1 Tax=Salmo salar TaxID=8030 RepID=A0A1S3SM20_SALSA|nr:interferon-induced very large GTPase 1 isoform X2 [Salmo salar]|eukprot:XP_014065392.1 PREDICTED: interferon-induced very large GTPase 1-like isoform X2 [Salmo salar]
MSYQQGAEGGAIPKERQKDGSPNKDLDDTMDPDMRNNLKHLQLRTASHMSMSDQSDQSVNSSRDPSDYGDQIMDERVHLQRPVSPAPSYISMKSDQSMIIPFGFKEGNLTQKEDVLLERAESPTLSYASANSHQSMDTDEEDEEENSAPKEKPGQVVCDICDEVKAVKSCLTCTQSYCETHVRKHYTLPKLQRHTLVEVTGSLEERLCQEHNRALEVFCRTDQKLICFECSVTKHKGHDMIIEEIKQAGRQTFDRDQCQRLKLTSVDEVLPPPGEIQFLSVTSDSVSLSWGSPEGLTGAQKFRVTWGCDGEQGSLRVEDGYNVEIDGLQPGKKFQFSVATEGEDGTRSRQVSASVFTVVPAPRDLQINQSGATSFTVSWSKAEELEKVPQRFVISYCIPGTEPCAANTEDSYRTLSGLLPGTQYTISVSTVLNNGEQSKPLSTTICTNPSPPSNLVICSYSATSAKLIWDHPDGMEDIQHHFRVTWCDNASPSESFTTKVNCGNVTGLTPGTEYTITVCTIDEINMESDPVCTNLHTKLTLKRFMQKLGLTQHFEEKLSLNEVISIDSLTPQSLPWCFLKELMRMNVSARDVKNITTDKEDHMKVNPLDLITALFLCSDGFLQQEMVQKMSMCQFAVPLLLPNCDTEQSTLMLWALRNIVKKFRPSSQADSKSFIEERIVLSDIPMVSFVGLGESTLSKSQIFNKLLTKPQQYNETFVHHNMECGNVPRTISDGLVEISWYLPCGNRNIDIFTKPMAVANLRGDIKAFEKQFSFLCQTSAAVYIFCDDLETDYAILEDNSKAELFLVVNSQRKTFTVDALRKFTSEFNINPTNVIVKENENDAEFVKTLQLSVGNITETSPNRLTIENMADVARQSGILVDEDSDECQSAKKMADEITSNIKDTVKFKDKQLPLQGQVWKEISQLEKERCRLRKAGGQDIEHYKSYLKRKEKEQREMQQRFGMTEAITIFITGMSSSKVERSYFLKWMQIHLDDLTWKNLSGLRERYKELCQNHPEKKDDIADLDRKMSNCSLGLEHFLRELGQLFEASCSLPEDSPQRQQMEHLPGLCAQMLLDGFPVELVDGDASNIPLKWISAVLTQLHTLVKSDSKIRVVTVLGVQSTGKSTLLNTMFGVQFAVSSGRCTRGAFMLLIQVNKELKEELKCDFIMVIDTEGLKSPELAQLDDSYEHDNELATLVIGLSDVTIINIAMENSTEMKDILQIVVHAFIRMKEVGKKPVCHFVHQNVSDMSAHDNNMRDRKKLLEQLNEMTQAAARMEKKENITKFTDVMEYDPDTSSCYIPGLWHGTPPMAPVNAGYSEAVYDLKKSLMQDLIKFQNNDDMTHFLKWTESLWETVKFEKFIFSFRNSLVADAYSRLCSEYSSWEWAFQKEMYSWMVGAETKMSNFGITDPNPQISIRNMLKDLMWEASEKMAVGEREIQDNLVKYFEKEDGHVNLVVKYKEDFVSSAKTLRRETENTVKNTLLEAVEIKEGMIELNNIKSSQTNTMEKKVLDLLQTCRQKKTDLSEQDLREEFESMWEETLSDINFSGLPERDVAQDGFLMLSGNLSNRGSHVNKILVGSSLVDCGKTDFVVKSVNWLRNAEGLAKHMDHYHHRKKLQVFCDDIITRCQVFITQKVKSKTGYHDTYIKELLNRIDETLQQHTKRKVSEECEVSLKQHICGIAAREFQKMHDDFIEVNNPKKCLEQSKRKYLTDFIDLFHNQDQCLKKAEEFTKLLQPAVQDYVSKMIGPDVVDEIKTGEGSEDYSTRMSFQFSVLKQLLTDKEYEKYGKYIRNYEKFVKDWLFDQIVQQLSKDSCLEKLEMKHLSEIVKIITDAISNIRKTTSTIKDIKTFIQNICSALGEKLVFPKDALDSIMILNSANTEQFADYLTEFVGEMEQTVASEYDQRTDIKERLRSLPFKPQDNMFTSQFGCGELCPFCKAPCEAGGKEHAKHFTSIHRPQGVTGRRNLKTRVLWTNICSSDVISDYTFQTTLTGDKYHPYKDYQTYYPDWTITGDSSIKASDYWKYVMDTYNERIAKDTDALPADIPKDWKALTHDDAMKSLKNIFNMK